MNNKLTTKERRELLEIGCGEKVTGDKYCGDTSMDNSIYSCPKCKKRLNQLNDLEKQ